MIKTQLVTDGEFTYAFELNLPEEITPNIIDLREIDAKDKIIKVFGSMEKFFLTPKKKY